jgi:type II secretory pathway pseudopilin PulG
MRASQKSKKHSALPLFFFSLFILFVTMLATVAVIQESQEIRQFAQNLPADTDPTPTLALDTTLQPDSTAAATPTSTSTPSPTPEEPTPTPTVKPSPTPQSPEETPIAPTSTPSISPTPIYRCNTSCTGNNTCPKSLFCANGVCRNPSCSKESDCVCNTNPPTKPVVYVEPTKKIEPTVVIVPTKGVTPSLAPIAFGQNKQTPRPTPDFEIFKTPKPNKSALELIVGFVADVFCKIFGCS